MYKVLNQYLTIYRVSWEVYNDDGSYEEYYSDWTFNRETAEKMRNNLLETAKNRTYEINVSDIITEFVLCSKEEVEILVNKISPLLED